MKSDFIKNLVCLLAIVIGSIIFGIFAQRFFNPKKEAIPEPTPVVIQDIRTSEIIGTLELTNNWDFSINGLGIVWDRKLYPDLFGKIRSMVGKKVKITGLIGKRGLTGQYIHSCKIEEVK